MATAYSKLSPYFSTQTYGTFLDVLTARAIPKNSLDIEYAITSVYEYRPDLLANDLYGRSQLWWVFAARNPNVIRDPIFDFYAGQVIYLPNQNSLNAALGL